VSPVPTTLRSCIVVLIAAGSLENAYLLESYRRLPKSFPGSVICVSSPWSIIVFVFFQTRTVDRDVQLPSPISTPTFVSFE